MMKKLAIKVGLIFAVSVICVITYLAYTHSLEIAGVQYFSGDNINEVITPLPLGAKDKIQGSLIIFLFCNLPNIYYVRKLLQENLRPKYNVGN